MNAPFDSSRAAVLPQFRAAIAILPKSHHALSAEALGLPRLLVRHRIRRTPPEQYGSPRLMARPKWAVSGVIVEKLNPETSALLDRLAIQDRSLTEESSWEAFARRVRTCAMDYNRRVAGESAFIDWRRYCVHSR
jgi:hypothetical protein